MSENKPNNTTNSGITFTELMSTFPSSLSDDLRESFFKMTLTSTTFQSIAAQAFTTELVDKCQKQCLKPTMTVQFVLTAGERDKLLKTFPNYKIDFRDSVPNGHAYAAALRNCREKAIIDSITNFGRRRPHPGRDFLYKNVGANPCRAFLQNHSFGHLCFPLIGPDDALRHEAFRTLLLRFNPKEASDYQRRFLQSIDAGSTRYLCTSPCESCAIPADDIIAMYVPDLTFDQIASSMILAHATWFHLVVPYDDSLFLFTEGVIPNLNMHFVKFRDSKTKNTKIRFYFRDGSNDYVHDWDNYVSFFTTCSFVRFGCLFVTELVSLGNGEAYVKICRTTERSLHGTIHRSLPLDTSSWLVVYALRRRAFNESAMSWLRWKVLEFVDPNVYQPGAYDYVRLVVETQAFNDALDHAFGLSESAFTFQKVFTFVNAITSKCWIAGTTASKPREEYTADTKQLIAQTVYILAYYRRWSSTQVIKTETSRILGARTTLSGLSRFCRLLAAAFAPEPDLGALTQLGLKSTTTEKKRELGQVCFSGMELLPAVLTLDEEIDYVCAGLRPRLPENSVLHEETPAAAILRAAVEDSLGIRQSVNTALPDLNTVEVLLSALSVNPHAVTSDGDCFFHALAASGVSVGRPSDARKELVSYAKRHHPDWAKQSGVAALDENAWFKIEWLPLAARFYQIKLRIVQTLDLCGAVTAYEADGGDRLVLLALVDEHFTPLIPGPRVYREHQCVHVTDFEKLSSELDVLRNRLENIYPAEHQYEAVKKEAFLLPDFRRYGHVCKSGPKLIDLLDSRVFARATVLDLGSGPGGWSKVAVAYGASHVDAVTRTIEHTYRDPKVTVYEADVFSSTRLPITNRYNVILCDIADAHDRDHPVEHARKIVKLLLNCAAYALPGAWYVAKFFNPEAGQVADSIRALTALGSVRFYKPAASTPTSAEFFCVIEAGARDSVREAKKDFDARLWAFACHHLCVRVMAHKQLAAPGDTFFSTPTQASWGSYKLPDLAGGGDTLVARLARGKITARPLDEKKLVTESKLKATKRALFRPFAHTKKQIRECFTDHPNDLVICEPRSAEHPLFATNPLLEPLWPAETSVASARKTPDNSESSPATNASGGSPIVPENYAWLEDLDSVSVVTPGSTTTETAISALSYTTELSTPAVTAVTALTATSGETSCTSIATDTDTTSSGLERFRVRLAQLEREEEYLARTQQPTAHAHVDSDLFPDRPESPPSSVCVMTSSLESPLEAIQGIDNDAYSDSDIWADPPDHSWPNHSDHSSVSSSCAATLSSESQAGLDHVDRIALRQIFTAAEPATPPPLPRTVSLTRFLDESRDTNTRRTRSVELPEITVNHVSVPTLEDRMRAAVSEFQAYTAEVVVREEANLHTLSKYFKQPRFNSLLPQEFVAAVVAGFPGSTYLVYSRKDDTRPVLASRNAPLKKHGYFWDLEAERIKPLSSLDTCESDHYLVCDYTVAFLDRRFLRLCESYQPTKPLVEFYQSGPGCGKTYTCLKLARACKTEFFILQSTRAAVDSVKDRLKKNGSGRLVRRVRTIHSFLAKPEPVETLFIDEVCQQHAGMVLLAIAASEAKSVVLFGDVHQIPFVCKIKDMTLHYRSIGSIFEPTKFLTESHRSPRDVLTPLNTVYDPPLTTANPDAGQTEFRIIGSVHDVERVPGAVYLTYMQDEKAQVLNAGYSPVNTVHEFQGSEADVIVVVRLNPIPGEEIYTRLTYATVAISRHRHRFIYCSLIEDPADKLLLLLRRAQHGLLGGGGNFVDQLRFRPDIAKASIKHVNNYTRDIQIPALHPKCMTKLLRRLDLGETVVVRPVYGVDHRLYLEDPSLTAREVIVRDNRGETLEVVDDYLSSLPQFVVREQNFLPDPHRENPDLDLGEEIDYVFDIAELQAYHNLIFPKDYCTITSEDTALIHTRPLQFYTQLIRWKPIKDYYESTIWAPLQPVLKTNIQERVPRSVRETILAIQKRNDAVPWNEGLVALENFADLLFKHFKGYLTVDEVYSPIHLSASGLTAWLAKQPLTASTAIGDHDSLVDPSLYEFLVKRNPKPSLQDGSAMTHAALQTVMSMPKCLNALFCPLFTEVRNRLIRALDQRFLINTLDTPEVFAARLSEVFPPARLAGVSKVHEIDISKFDKSQGLLALLLEIKLLEYFGVQPEVLEIWRYAHTVTHFKDYSTGIRGDIFYQRKSGDALTFLGNTMFLMSVMAYVFDLSTVAAAVFSGDDSVIFGGNPRFPLDTDLFTGLFNLHVKFYSFQSIHFCSKFFLALDDKNWLLEPDPLKILVKLGRRDLMNKDHRDEYSISYRDQVKHYAQNKVVQRLAAATRERYRLDFDPTPIILLLAKAVDHFDELFTPVGPLLPGGALPSLEI